MDVLLLRNPLHLLAFRDGVVGHRPGARRDLFVLGHQILLTDCLIVVLDIEPCFLLSFARGGFLGTVTIYRVRYESKERALTAVSPPFQSAGLRSVKSSAQ